MRHPVRSALLIAGLSLALWHSSAPVSTQSTPQYGVTDLGTLGGSSSVALAIDDVSFPGIFGYSTTASGETHAFAARAGGGISDLGTLGGASSEARGSYIGRAVGRAQLASGAFHAFMQTDTFPQTLRDLGTLGGTTSGAEDIEWIPEGSKYLVVGASQTAGNAATRAFVYDTGTGTMRDLGATLGGRDTAATAINSSQHVVGWAQMPESPVGEPHYHAFVYAGGVTQDLGAMGGASSYANAINDSDVIVGNVQFYESGAYEAFRYQNGAMQTLGTFGGGYSDALAVSPAGVIVGWAATSAGIRHAFIWRDGVMTDLNTLIPQGTGWVLQEATAIGSGAAGREMIAGVGTLNGQTRAFVLTPPLDLRIALHPHENNLDTNFPNPHTAGDMIPMGATVWNNSGYTATNVTVTDTLTGPVQIAGWDSPGPCSQSGLQLTCRLPYVDGAGIGKDLIVYVRATGPGAITHQAAIVSADQPDPTTANNSAGPESNTAVSLASLTLATSSVQGGQPVLGRATATSQVPGGGARVTLTSSNPDVASVPSPFDILRGCCDDMWREFYVTTHEVSAPVTVQISATYGLVTKTQSLTITPSGGGSLTPYGGSPAPVPGIIPAANFDNGGEGVAYHDTSAGNSGGQYRSTDVDIESSSEGGYDVGWIAAGEFLNYTVNVASSGSYNVALHVASPGGASLHVGFNGPSAGTWKTVTVPATGGWQNWTTVNVPVNLGAGVQQMTLMFDTGGMNVAYANVTGGSSGGSGTLSPFTGTPAPVPGQILAANFDNGGEGVAYHDTSSGNSGGAYRSTDVDLEASSEGGYDVGWAAAGEWLNYTTNVSASGSYTVQLRVASPGGATLHVGFNGPSAGTWKTVMIPATGGWQAWTTVNVPVTLGAGTQQMTIYFDTGGSNFLWARVQ